MNARVMQVVTSSDIATILMVSNDGKHKVLENISIASAKRLCMDENSPFDNVYGVGVLYGRPCSKFQMRPARLS